MKLSHEKTSTWLRKGNLKKESEFLLIAAQQRLETNFVNARIDKAQQNSICRQCSDRDKMIIHIMSKCSKIVQREFKTRAEWVGKMMNWE